MDLFIGCVCLPTQGNIKHICSNRFKLLEEDISLFKSKGRVLLLVDFNARVGKSNDVDDVIGMFGELLVIVTETC